MSENNDNQFGELYAQYYDLLYKDKDYDAEVSYIDNLFNSDQKLEILDLGCGTGKHCELFVEKGHKVHGIDLSDNMLEIAETRRAGKEELLSFEQANIAKYKSDKKYDRIVSLFHVMSYQAEQKDLVDTLNVVKNHLKDGGQFIFDFWYGPAVLTDLPKTRVKRLENDKLSVTRIAESNLFAQRNVVEVNFDLFMENKSNGEISEKTETHLMRYFFDTELEYLCQQLGFSVKQKYEWLSDKTPDFSSWNVVWVIEKN